MLTVAALYHFTPFPDPQALKAPLAKCACSNGVRGTLLLAPEGINGTIAFVSLIFWAYLLGALGALIAIPATLFLKSVLLDNSVPASWVNALISSNPKDDRPEPPIVTRRSRQQQQSKRPAPS